MVEVFKTNVSSHAEASMLISEIHRIFTDHIANFDLEDCDRILRVQFPQETNEVSPLMELIRDFGFHAEILT
ncbi:MAG: hypothetical protein ABIR19_09315 [Ginsengibacter sp.]